MSVIENFVVLSEKEQREFAEALLKTINSESIFSSDTDFELVRIEADDITGGLMIEVSHTIPVEVSRQATWQASNEEDAADDPGYDADYENSITKDAEKSFKTLSTTIDGYIVSLEISDVDENDTTEVKVDSISHEDDGIGHYEYWGFEGNDSRPYVEVEGTIVKECDCSLAFFVEPEFVAE
jgi:hypothetical protein